MYVAVVGAGDAPEAVRRQAEAVGRGLASRGAVLVAGVQVAENPADAVARALAGLR